MFFKGDLWKTVEITALWELGNISMVPGDFTHVISSNPLRSPER